MVNTKCQKRTKKEKKKKKHFSLTKPNQTMKSKNILHLYTSWSTTSSHQNLIFNTWSKRSSLQKAFPFLSFHFVQKRHKRAASYAFFIYFKQSSKSTPAKSLLPQVTPHKKHQTTNILSYPLTHCSQMLSIHSSLIRKKKTAISQNLFSPLKLIKSNCDKHNSDTYLCIFFICKFLVFLKLYVIYTLISL